MSGPSQPSPFDVGGYGQPPPTGRKRNRSDDQIQPGVPHHLDQPLDPYDQGPGNVPVGHHPPQGYPLQPFPPAGPPPTGLPQQQQQQPQQTHHHHHLPHQRPTKMARITGEEPTSPQIPGPPSMVGQEGMPPPAPRPRGPKLKFTPEDDQLLVDLKEKKNLTWKQIADFFPGRSSGTLQVRYCTKLKAKTTVWTDEMVQKLRTAMHEYENDRWRIISSKVGSGFSAAACREKAQELEALEAEEEEEQSGYTQAQIASSSSDPAPTFQ
ncbi:hypothetical protein CC78DRAFT_186588 [Lojkania enalia]|uniref:Myb-like domain-containing protein n=1 Tax=Lojkania enalia TaxID=147567 RepID=A0A9P4KFK9_9PLEO|nr:hypothetical protein CC78DRAFT_186588 [Didymosphaeria enalia]